MGCIFSPKGNIYLINKRKEIVLKHKVSILMQKVIKQKLLEHMVPMQKVLVHWLLEHMVLMQKGMKHQLMVIMVLIQKDIEHQLQVLERMQKGI